jgi:hypothetical protein
MSSDVSDSFYQKADEKFDEAIPALGLVIVLFAKDKLTRLVRNHPECLTWAYNTINQKDELEKYIESKKDILEKHLQDESAQAYAKKHGKQSVAETVTILNSLIARSFEKNDLAMARGDKIKDRGDKAKEKDDAWLKYTIAMTIVAIPAALVAPFVVGAGIAVLTAATAVVIVGGISSYKGYKHFVVKPIGNEIKEIDAQISKLDADIKQLKVCVETNAPQSDLTLKAEPHQSPTLDAKEATSTMTNVTSKPAVTPLMVGQTVLKQYMKEIINIPGCTRPSSREKPRVYWQPRQ